MVLSQCTAEVAHFSLQWWTEPSALKHQSNPQGENNLRVHRPKGDKSPWKYRVMFYEPPPLSVLPSAYSRLCSELSEPGFMGSDSFYVRVNLNIEPHDEPQSLGVSCDDIIHVTDTRYKGKYQWHCSVVDPHTAKPLQTGTMPNYNRLDLGFTPLIQMEIVFVCTEVVCVLCCIQVTPLCLYNSFGALGFPQGAADVAGQATEDGARAEGLQEEGG